MIKALRISDSRTLPDLKVNAYYAGTYKDGYIHLNRFVRARIGERLQENKPYLVRINKVSLPNEISVSIINDEFEVVNEPPSEKGQVDEKLKTLPFMIRSEYLEKLRPRFIQAAMLIKKAIAEKRPILVRHHSDVDGYSAAIALERAIQPLIVKQHDDDNAVYKFYMRSPCQAPYYSYEDAVRDVSTAMLNVSKFGQKKPLLIVLDNGSTKEDTFGLKKVKIYGFQIIVVDHHNPGEVKEGKSINDELIDVHINAYLVEHHAGLVAGMLAAELAKFVNEKVENIDFIPALAGTADKADNDEFSQYLKLSGKDKEFLEELAMCIDYEADVLRHMTGSDLVNDLFGDNPVNQKKAMDLLLPEINQQLDAMKLAIEKYHETRQYRNLILFMIDIEKVGFRGEFPPPGKIVGLMHRQHLGSPVISLGIMDTMIIIRADDVKGFDANKMISEIQQKLPYALIDGGGHEFAATIRFVKGAKEEVLAHIVKYLERF